MRVAVFLLAFVISGCASVPLGTLLEFRNYSVDDLGAIQPQQIRAQIQVDEPVLADAQSSMLQLEISKGDKVQLFTFPLELIGEHKIQSESGLFFSSAGKTQYELRLSEQAINSFKEAQQLLARQKPAEFKFTVSTSFEKLPENTDEIILSILLKLSDEQDYMLLFDNARLEVKREG